MRDGQTRTTGVLCESLSMAIRTCVSSVGMTLAMGWQGANCYRAYENLSMLVRGSISDFAENGFVR
jgi:hypothetical protein